MIAARIRLAVIGLALTLPTLLVARVVTLNNDGLATGWYPDQNLLSPQLVSGGTFGRLFTTTITGQVYAQPLVYNGIVLVATEGNWAYGIDAVTGAIRWSRSFGTPWNPQDIACSDLLPQVGVTGTPVIDDTSNTAYLLSKGYVSGSSGAARWQMHALDMTTGAERTGFPVTIQGTASNNPQLTFAPTTHHQRPGLILMNGVVYASFGGHCDVRPYQGWVVGVTTSGVLRTMWNARAGSPIGDGNGIWMSGGGPVSDRTGSLIVTTGNAFGTGTPTVAIPGNQPPADLGESVIRLDVQGNGTLRATDFFTPFDAPEMDINDADLGSGAPVGLPSPYFGTAAIPNLLIQVGKQGYTYLLNRDNLGGSRQGSGGGDLVVNRVGPFGGAWSHPAVWPGNGGYIYIVLNQGRMGAYAYGLDGTGKPTFSAAGNTADSFGYGSSSPIVTSSGAASGTALVWVVFSPDGTGNNAQLRAYDPVPVAGQLVLRYSAPVGQAAKFTPPGVGTNRIYVGTRDGHLVGFGAPVTAQVSAPAVSFPDTIVGQTSTLTETITATTSTTVSALSVSGTAFTLGTASRTLPAVLSAGQTITVPVNFAPTATGAASGTLQVSTSGGVVQAALSGTGLAPTGVLAASPVLLSFGGAPIGSVLSGSARFSNIGGTAVTIQQILPPSSPFSISGAPGIGSTLAAGASVTVNVTFAPTSIGQFTGALSIVSSGGTADVPLSGSGALPGVLTISPLSLAYGTIGVGASQSLSFTVSNTGGSTLTITKSKPPVLGQFTATTNLFEGTTLAPAQSLTETVRFAPTVGGTFTDGWIFNSDQPGSVLQTVSFTGVGDPNAGTVIPDPVSGGWTLNGSASLLGTTPGSLLQLTPASGPWAGSAFWPTPVPSSSINASFDATIGGGTGADGMTFILADPAQATPASLGIAGSSLGFCGINGTVGVGLVTFTQANPSSNFVGIANSCPAFSTPTWLVTNSTIPSLRSAVRHIAVTVASGTLAVSIDGVQVLSRAVTLTPTVLVGFSAGTGGLADQHAVSNVSITAGGTSGALSVTPGTLSFGNVQTGTTASQTVSIANTGSGPLTINSTTGPAVPFSATGLPAPGTTIAAGQSVTSTIRFSPTAAGAASSSLSIASSVGTSSVALSGTGVTVQPAVLSVTPSSLAFGNVQTGSTASQTVTIANTGGSSLTITSTISPGAPFSVSGLPASGAAIAAGASVVATVQFAPTTAATSNGTLTIVSSVGTSTVSISGTGTAPTGGVPDPTAGGWRLNGSTTLLGTTPGSLLQLTPATGPAAGTAFWPTPVASAGLTAAFDATIGGGTGADGMTFIIADPAQTTPTALGTAGGGLGFCGIPGSIAVGLVTFQQSNPSANFVGIANACAAYGSPTWLVTSSSIPPLRTAKRHVVVAVANGTMTVSVDGTQVLSRAAVLSANVLVGFSGGTGGSADQHAVSNVSITSGSAGPGVLSVTPASIAFGNVTTGTTAPRTVTIANTGGSPLTISSTTSPAAPFSATGLPAAGTSIAAGQSVTAIVNFAPVAATASSGTLTVVSSAGTSSVALTGTGVLPPAVLSVSPATLTFGSITTGTTSSKSVTIANTGGSPLTITALSSLAAPFSATGLPAVGATIAAGQSVTATVTYAPTAAATSNATFTVTSSVGSGSVAMSGTGVPPVAVLSVTPATRTFGSVTTGTTSSLPVTIANTGGSPLTITAVTSLSAPYSVTGLPAVGATIAAGASVSATVTYAPTAATTSNATLTVTSSVGSGSVAISGTGVLPAAVLSVSPATLTFGSITTGTTSLKSVTIANTGGSPLTITAVTSLSAPYSVTGLPAVGATIAAGASVTATVTYAPTAATTSNATLTVTSSVGSGSVAISGTGVLPAAALSVTPATLAFGSVTTGTTSSKSVTIANTGGSALIITAVTSPAAPFSVTGLPAVGATLAAGQSVTASVTFAPTSTTTSNSTLSVTSSAGGGSVAISGTGATGSVVPDPVGGGWKLNGRASMLGTTPGSKLQLTPASGPAAGSAYWPTAVPSAHLTATFDVTIGGGTGADGMTFILSDPAQVTSSAIGIAGGSLGFCGIPGSVAVGFVTFTQANPSANLVGIANSCAAYGSPTWLVSSSSIPGLRTAPRHVVVAVNSGTMTVSVDGTQVLSRAVTLPSNVLVGFSGGTGGLNDQHAVSNVSVTATP